MNTQYLETVSLKRLRLKQELIRLAMFMAAFKKDQEKANLLFKIDSALEKIINEKLLKTKWEDKKLVKVRGKDVWIRK